MHVWETKLMEFHSSDGTLRWSVTWPMNPYEVAVHGTDLICVNKWTVSRKRGSTVTSFDAWSVLTCQDLMTGHVRWAAVGMEGHEVRTVTRGRTMAVMGDSLYWTDSEGQLLEIGLAR
jgi:hypothetical protein